MRLRRFAVATLTCAAALLLAGCGEKEAGVAAPAVAPVLEASGSASSAPPSSPSSSPPPAPSSSPAAKPTSATVAPAAPAQPGGIAASRTPAGAAQVMERFLHAVGTKDAATACAISESAFGSNDPGGGPAGCQDAFGYLFSQLTEPDLVALRAAKVDAAQVVLQGADKALIPEAAITPVAPFVGDQGFGDTVLGWSESAGTWQMVE